MRLAILLTLGSLIAAPAAFAATTCAALQSIALPDTTITAAESIAAGVLPGLSPQTKVPAFCKVRGILHPTPDSVIRFEVWLPADTWNGRLVNVGNGGFAGSIGYSQMVSNLLHGYATAGSDAGHQADAEDASWAYHHPEKIADFGYRAVHLTALRSKDLVKAFYGSAQKTAYFDACSDGGREALMEAQRFPEDYDGILAGAPANNWAHMLSAAVVLSQATTRDPEAYLSSMKLPAITKASLMACDAADGLKDGIVSDPEHCSFNPAVLLCKGVEDTSCLTAPQVASLKTLYAGAKNAKGEIIFPGLLPGDENPVWHDWVLGNAPGGASGANYMTGYFRYMVMNDPSWSPLTADADAVLQLAMDRTARDVDATDPDLSRFVAHGGKMILYHGWNDPAISPWNTIAYYKQMSVTMGTERMASAVRLYMVPGMEHCAGGPGPNEFGQLGLPTANGSGSGSGALDVLEMWVEGGPAPSMLLAARVSGTREAPVKTVRPLCPYPQSARYDGKGDPKLPASFTCTAP